MKLGLLLSPDLRAVARKVKIADLAVKAAQDPARSPRELKADLVRARTELADVLEALTGRRPSG